MIKKLSFVLITICLFPLMVFAGGYVEGESANEYFSELKGEVHNVIDSSAVLDGPWEDNIFTLFEAIKITGIWTYHWNADNFDNATISLVNTVTNEVYGPWDVVFDKGSLDREKVNWYVFPDEVIPAGTYKIVDSHQDSWSHTFGTGNVGFATVKGLKRIGDVEVDGTNLKPVVGQVPFSFMGTSTEKYKFLYQLWADLLVDGSATIFEDGKGYLYRLYIEPNDGYYFDENDKVSISGVVWDNPVSSYTDSGPYKKGCLSFRGTTWAYNVEHSFIRGNNLSTSDLNEFIFEIDGDYDDFMDGGEVYIGHNLLSSSFYTVQRGSTIISLTSEYTRRLDPGKIQFLRVVFGDGSGALTNFIREDVSIPEIDETDDGEEIIPEVPSREENPSDNEELEPEVEETIPEINEEEETPEVKVNNPETSDNVGMQVLICLISLLGLVSTVIYLKFN